MLKMIAEGAIVKSQIKQQIKNTFTASRQKYVEAAQQYVTLLNGQAECRVTINHAEANRKGIEAAWIREGLVVGKNQVERDACLAELRDGHELYQRLVDEEWTAKDALMRSEADVERLKMELRICRLDLEMSIGEMRVLAGEESERLYER